jgi:hypothetical protein
VNSAARHKISSIKIDQRFTISSSMMVIVRTNS